MNQRLKQKTVFWGFANYASLLATLVTTAVLSRLLTPSEFGVVSVTTAFTAFFAVLTDLGYGTAIIHHQHLDREDLNSIFSLSVYFSIFLAVAFALLGIPISLFYENPVYRKICLFLASGVLLSSLNTVPSALIMKEKRFWNSGLRMIVACVVAGAIAIWMAVHGFSYYAIIFQNLLFSLITFVWNFSTSGLRFRFRPKLASFNKVRSFSSYQFLFSFLRYLAGNADALLIGKVMGSDALAYYDKGHKLMMYPVQNLTNYVVNPILVPVLSEHQEDRTYIYQAYQKVVSVLSYMGVLISVVFFWASRECVLLFFGGQWEAAVPVFHLLSLSVWPQLVASSASAIYQSTGDTRRMFRSGLVYFITMIVLILASIFSGSLMTVAVCVVLGQYVRFAVDYYVLIHHTLSASCRAFFRSFWFEALYTAVMICVILLVKLPISSLMLSLLVKGCIALIVFIALGLPTDKLAQFLGMLFSRRGRQTRRTAQ